MQGSPITSAARPVLRPVLCRLAFREGGGRTAVEGPRPVASAFVRAEFSGLGGRVGERVGFSGGAVEVSALSRLRHPQFLSRLRNSALHCQTIPEIPPKRGELRTELLGLKERQHKPQTSQQ
nr:uncharacterized protein LOC100342621 isoform X4 [Oryctolagus cuniculus]